MKKGKISTKKLLSLALYSATVVGTVGAIAGTYAWYSYNNYTYVSFKGTSVSNVEGFDIGLVSDTDLFAAGTANQIIDHYDVDAQGAKTPVYQKDANDNIRTFATKYKNAWEKQETTRTVPVYNADGTPKMSGDPLAQETKDETVYIFWAHEEIDAEMVHDFLIAKGYATDEMHPVTSGKFDYTADSTDKNLLKLKQSPATANAGEGAATVYSTAAADKGDYVYLPLAFRVNDLDAGAYVKNSSVALKKVQTHLGGASATAVENSIRIHAVDPTNASGTITAGNGAIFNPTAAEDYDLPVAGLLNLNAATGDQYFDYTSPLSSDPGKEIVYGEVTADGVTWNTVANAEDSDKIMIRKSTAAYAEEEADPQTASTFAAFHKRGKKSVASFTATTATTHKAGALFGENAVTLAKTASDDAEDKRVAYLDITAWNEGWDLSIIDANANQEFALAFQFEAK